MLTILKRRGVLVAIGFVLFALFVLIVGPYIAIAGYEPLRLMVARLLLITLAVLAWLVVYLLKIRRSQKASESLMAAVVEQKVSARSTESATQLRESFKNAVAYLKQQRRSRSLYDLPWYVIIGAPG